MTDDDAQVPPPPSPDGETAARHPVHRAARVWGGMVLLVVGAIVAPTPIPVGLAMMAVGLYLLAAEMPWARKLVRWIRRKIPPFSRALDRLRPKVGAGVRHFIETTAPDARDD